MTPQEREELKKLFWKEKAEKFNESQEWLFEEITDFFLSHIDHILETKALALEKEKEYMHIQFERTNDPVVNARRKEYNNEYTEIRNSALDFAISILRGK